MATGSYKLTVSAGQLGVLPRHLTWLVSDFSAEGGQMVTLSGHVAVVPFHLAAAVRSIRCR